MSPTIPWGCTLGLSPLYCHLFAPHSDILWVTAEKQEDGVGVCGLVESLGC